MILSIFILLNITNCGKALPSNAIHLVVDGKDITVLASPIIENNRVLVPLRFVSEEIGAAVSWDGINRTVNVENDNKSVHLWIGSHLVEYNNGEVYNLSDVAPIIIMERTYVPLRLLSNALGIGIEWDEKMRTVYVDSKKTSTIEPFFDVRIMSHESGDKIFGRTDIQVVTPDSYQSKVKEIKLLLLDRDTAKGFVVAKEKQLDGNLVYLPKVEDKGEKVLVVAIYNESGRFIGGDSILVNIDVKPEVSLTGIESLGIIKDTVSISQHLNFLATYVKYEITKLENGKITTFDEQDPQGTYSWTPTMKQNGACTIKVIAYDGNGIAYESKILNTTVAVDRELSLIGVTEGMILTRPVNLLASRNFDVSETQYISKDVNTLSENIIATIPYGGYKWFPKSEDSGDKDIVVRVKDTHGVTYESKPIRVKVDGSPKILIEGIGPNQVLTSEIKLAVKSNVELESINYTLTNSNTGAKRYIGTNLNSNEEYSFVPLEQDSGDMTIKAEGIYEGTKILSESISFSIYLGTLYGPEAITEKDEFLKLASYLANDSWNKTGMSAALQIAQALLETGWGQSIAVDKYSGKFSYNLFGIKGTGINGSVISNTWEVYNGVAYRIDAEFRAYNSVKESWEDHKSLLLNAARYEPFREVMYDSTLGAWAIRRAGYATDPQYSMKLMRIIKQYNLKELDKVGIGL